MAESNNSVSLVFHFIYLLLTLYEFQVINVFYPLMATFCRLLELTILFERNSIGKNTYNVLGNAKKRFFAALFFGIEFSALIIFFKIKSLI